MKNYFVFVLFLMSTLFLSCEDNTSINQDQETFKPEASKSVYSNMEEEPVRFAIFEMSWNEWGRTSKGCKGLGLCEATICWFCCFDANDVRVPCSDTDSNATRKSYRAQIDLDTKIGELYIPMSHDTEEEIIAIADHSIFYVDEDIVQPEFTIHSGEYVFDSTVGDFGGYRVVVSIP